MTATSSAVRETSEKWALGSVRSTEMDWAFQFSTSRSAAFWVPPVGLKVIL